MTRWQDKDSAVWASELTALLPSLTAGNFEPSVDYVLAQCADSDDLRTEAMLLHGFARMAAVLGLEAAGLHWGDNVTAVPGVNGHTGIDEDEVVAEYGPAARAGVAATKLVAAIINEDRDESFGMVHDIVFEDPAFRGNVFQFLWRAIRDVHVTVMGRGGWK